MAPPYTTICCVSIAVAACAALGDGTIPCGASFTQHRFGVVNKYVSPVIVKRPASPVAPPKRMAFWEVMEVMVCPKRGCNGSPMVSTGS